MWMGVYVIYMCCCVYVFVFMRVLCVLRRVSFPMSMRLCVSGRSRIAYVFANAVDRVSMGLHAEFRHNVL
jgi:hypothetical protein